MIEVPLSRGKVALIDDEDAALAARRWFAVSPCAGTVWYAQGAELGPDGKRHTVLLHRLVMRAPRGVHVDHINGDGLDCRRVNLRLATRRENQRNRRLPRNNTSGFKGVSRAQHGDGLWRADIRADGVQHYLGCFRSPEEAARAYDAAAERLFGDFARTNRALGTL